MFELEEEFKLICRVCMGNPDNLVSIFEDKSLIQLLCQAADINITLDDILPKQICSTCITDAKYVMEFKNKCQTSDNKLRTMASVKLEEKVDLIKFKIDTFDSSICLESFNSAKSVVNDSKNELNLIPEDAIKSESILLNMTDESQSDLEIFKNDEFSHYGTLSTEIEECITCSKCDAIFEFEKDLKKHVKKYHSKIQKKQSRHSGKNNSPSFTKKQSNDCSQCKISFKTKKNFQDHHREKHKSTWVPKKCLDCFKIFETKKVYERHKCVHSSLKPIQCPKCPNRFKSQMNLEKHLYKNHTANKHYSCDICKIKFTSVSEADRHSFDIHSNEEGKYDCLFCSRKLPSNSLLQAHIETHLVNGKFKCPHCPRNFKVLGSLIVHMKAHPKQQDYLCFLCGKSFKSKGALVEHVARHNGLKQFICDYCQKSFVTKNELIAHLRVHTGEHPFVCDVCGSAFTTSSALRKHTRIHTGQKPHACEYCPMRFICPGVLKNHRRTHTGEKPFKCTYCPKAFCKNSNLKSHIRTHTNEHPYVCPTCGQAFKQSGSLRSHCKQHAVKEHHTNSEATIITSGTGHQSLPLDFYQSASNDNVVINNTSP